jgi:hypothetical protein
VADTSFVGESAATLAASLTRLRTNEDARERAVRRGVAAAAVAVLHVAMIFVLIQTDWIPSLRARAPAEAPLLWLLLPKAPSAPKAEQQRSQKPAPREAFKTYTLPITLPPPPPSNAITDPALALGQALACGANSFEYLTPQGRANCRRPPWNYTYARDGTIVLDTQYKPPEPKPTPAEVMQLERYTAPTCPSNVDPNAPCLSRIIHGR